MGEEYRQSDDALTLSELRERSRAECGPLLPKFREDAKRDRWGAELHLLMELRWRYGHDAVCRHLSRIRAILERQGEKDGHHYRAA